MNLKGVKRKIPTLPIYIESIGLLKVRNILPSILIPISLRTSLKSSRFVFRWEGYLNYKQRLVARITKTSSGFSGNKGKLLHTPKCHSSSRTDNDHFYCPHIWHGKQIVIFTLKIPEISSNVWLLLFSFRVLICVCSNWIRVICFSFRYNVDAVLNSGIVWYCHCSTAPLVEWNCSVPQDCTSTYNCYSSTHLYLGTEERSFESRTLCCCRCSVSHLFQNFWCHDVQLQVILGRVP